MRKKLLVLGLAAIVGASSIPAGYMLSKAPVVASAEENDDADSWEDEDEDEESGQLTEGYVVVSPAKKTIKVGKSFYIDLYPSDEFDSEYGDLPDEEWDELIEENHRLNTQYMKLQTKIFALENGIEIEN